MDTTGRWKEFSMPFAVDTFYVRYYGFGPLFFSDSLTGYWLLYSRRKYPDTAGQGVYRTKDAGATWHRWADKTPFPHEQKGAWAIGKSGFRSSDSGRTWERIGVRGTDSAQTIAYGSFSNAGLPKVMAALYAYRPTRLAFTLDGGATWIFTDTLEERKEVDPNDSNNVFRYNLVSDTTLFGAVPVASSPNSIVWKKLLGIVDSTLYVTLTDERDNGYLWVMDLAKRSGTVHRIPLYPNLTLLRHDLMVAWDANAGVALRSSDSGKTWDRTEGLKWVHWGTVRFFPNGYAIGSNAQTTDAGRTWKPSSIPYGVGAFWPVDTLHWFTFAGSWPTPQTSFARTSDGGYSWKDNGIFGFYTGGGVHDGVLLQGTETGHFLRSSDSAQTWSDLRDIPGALPNGVVNISHIAWPNGTRNPEWVMAIATQTSPTSPQRVCMIESRDTGQTWQVTRTYDSASLLNSRIQFIENSERLTAYISMNNRFYRSTDTLRTWELRSEEPMLITQMIDNQIGVAGRKGELLRSTDGGASWLTTQDLTEPTRTTPTTLAVLGNGHVVAVAPDQLASNDKWTLYYSGNNGGTWETAQSHSPIREWGSVLWLSPARAYMRAGGRLGYSTDSGQSFVSVRSIAYGGFQRDDNYIYFVSLDDLKAGRWRIGGEPTTGVAMAPTVVESVRLGENILKGEGTVLRLRLASASKVRVAAVTMAGEEQPLLGEQHLEAGEHTLPIEVSGLASGRYLIEVQFGGNEPPRLLPLVIQR